MLYKYGTMHEVCKSASQFPEEVLTALLSGIEALDREYGQDRDYMETGGYSIIIETEQDLIALREIVNVDKRPCEWAMRLGTSGFVCALYVLNNDFSIMLTMPETIAPQSILQEIES